MQIFINTREGQFNYWAVWTRHHPGKSSMTLYSGRLGDSLVHARIKTRTNPVPETINHNRDALVALKLAKGYVRYPHDFECLLADVENGHVHPGTEFSPVDSMFSPPSITSGTREIIMIKTTGVRFEYWRFLLEMNNRDPGCRMRIWNDSLENTLRPPKPSERRFENWSMGCRAILHEERRLLVEGYTLYGREFMFLDGDVRDGTIRKGEPPPGISTHPATMERRVLSLFDPVSAKGSDKKRKARKRKKRNTDPVRPEDMSSVIPGRVKRRIDLP